MAVLAAILLALQGAPFPREKTGETPAAAWEFEGADGWKPLHDCTAQAAGGSLAIQSSGGDPYLEGPPFRAPGPVLVRLRVKSSGAGPGEFFWATEKSPGMSPDRSVRFEMDHDGAWHEVQVAIDEAGTVTRLRLDPGPGPGRIEVDWIRLSAYRLHPIEVVRLAQDGTDLRVTARNHEAGGKETDYSFPIDPSVPFPRIPFAIRTPGLPDLRRTVVGYNPDVKRNWVPLRAGAGELLLDPDGEGAVLRLDGRPAAIVAPLVEGVEGWTREGTAFRSGAVRVSFSASDAWFACAVEADRAVEGPVVRALGPLEAGLFAGIEYRFRVAETLTVGGTPRYFR